MVDPATGDTIRIVDPLAASDPVHLYHLTLVGDSQQNLAAPSEGISKIKVLPGLYLNHEILLKRGSSRHLHAQEQNRGD